jgi:HSP20 family protein
MDLTSHLFSDAYRELQRAMAAFDEPFYHVGHSNRLLGSSRGDSSSMFSPFSNRFGDRNQQQGLLHYPAIDIDETADAYEVSAELPGYDKKDIKIEVGDDERTLILSGSVDHQYEKKSSNFPIEEGAGKKDQQKEKKKEKGQHQQQVIKKDDENSMTQFNPDSQWWVNERVSGAFTRTFHFPNPINPNGIKTNYKNGILKVTVPKSKDKSSIQIDID